MKLGYFAFPHLGGTFFVYRALRAGLRHRGVDLRWIATGAAAHQAANDLAWAHERPYGHLCGQPGDSEQQQAQALVRLLGDEQFDGLFVNVLADRVQTNVVRYLPEHMLRVMIVHNITPATYGAARAIRDNVHATVGVSPRIHDDLVYRYGFADERTFAIQNAVEIEQYAQTNERTRTNGSLRLLSLGRIDDQAKGVLWLPAIMRKLPEQVTLTVAGDGLDLPRLQALSAKFGERIRFIGSVGPERVPRLFAEHDALIAPSRFEGFMITLVEAMAAGCVPVASLIRGVTDWVVQQGRTGLLFPVGDTKGAARCIKRLLDDPALLATLSAEGRRAVKDRFSVETMAARYGDVLKRIAADRPEVSAPLQLTRWEVPSGLAPGLRTYLPRPVKNLLRAVKERVAL